MESYWDRCLRLVNVRSEVKRQRVQGLIETSREGDIPLIRKR